MFVVCRSLIVDCWLLSDPFCLVFVALCVLFPVGWLRVDVCCLSFAFPDLLCVLFVVCCLLCVGFLFVLLCFVFDVCCLMVAGVGCLVACCWLLLLFGRRLFVIGCQLLLG